MAEGFEEIEAVSIADILRRSGMEVCMVSVTGRLEVRGSHEIGVIADELFENAGFDTVDMIILPGGMPGALNLNRHEGLRREIIEFNGKGKFLGAICAAPMVLGDLGILENRKATCYPGFSRYLHGAQLKAAPVVADGNIITGNGPGAAIQFALKIVEMHRGKDAADTLAGKLMLPGS